MILKETNLYENDRKIGKGGIIRAYLPDNSVEVNQSRKRPAMLILPGGGYNSVSFREAEPVALKFLAHGFSCFVLHYDVYPFSYPVSPLIEGAMAMKHIRDNAQRYNVDENKVAVVGFSAGGHLASYLATCFTDKLFRDYFGENNVSDIRPNAAIYAYAVTSCDIPTASGSIKKLSESSGLPAAEFSTELKVSENSSPAFMWATSDDETVNAMHTLKMAEAYQKSGVAYSLRIYPTGQHGLSVADEAVYRTDCSYRASENLSEWVNDAVDFLKFIGIKTED